MRRFTGKLLMLVAVFCAIAAMSAAQDKPGCGRDHVGSWAARRISG